MWGALGGPFYRQIYRQIYARSPAGIAPNSRPLTGAGDFPKLRACLGPICCVWPVSNDRPETRRIDIPGPQIQVNKRRESAHKSGPTNPVRQFLRDNENKEVVNNMVKIRMMRMGSKKRPFYRVMAIDERKQRDGRPLEFLGTYDPRIEPPAVKLNLEGIDGWIGKGAQLSDTVRSLVNGVRRSGNAAAAGVSNNNV